MSTKYFETNNGVAIGDSILIKDDSNKATFSDTEVASATLKRLYDGPGGSTAQFMVTYACPNNLAGVYNNGSSGVGATITPSDTALSKIDNTTIQVNDKVLFMAQTNGYENGIYNVSQTQSPSSTDSWTSEGSVKNWIPIACGSDGSRLLSGEYGGYVYTSIDYGESWTARQVDGTNTYYWKDAAMSSDGKYLYIVCSGSGNIAYSQNYGASWIFDTENLYYDMRGVACSTSGQYAYTCYYNGFIWKSSNYGGSWSGALGGTSRNYTDVACSDNGQYIYLTVYGANYIYYSTDYGANWNGYTTLGTGNWVSVCCSADGATVIAAQNGYCYKSTNYGANWSQFTAMGTKNWVSVDMSGDGTVIIGATSANHVWISRNSGTSFVDQTSPSDRTWKNVCTNSTGSYLYGTAYGNYVWKDIYTTITYFLFTRHTSYDQSAELVSGISTTASGGSTYSGVTFYLGNNVTTVGTTAQNWVPAAASYETLVWNYDGYLNNAYLNKDYGIVCNEVAEILMYPGSVIGMAFMNKTAAANIDMQIYKNGVLVYTWEIRSRKNAYKTTGINLSFAAGDLITVYGAFATSTAPTDATFKMRIREPILVMGEGGA